MQQFTVPQFIDVEDKIIGPITTRQFIIMLVGFMLAAIFYKIFDFSLFLTLSVITFALVGVFSFARVNGRPFHFFLLNLIQTLKRPAIRVWNHRIRKNESDFNGQEPKINIVPAEPVKRFNGTKLAELSLIVDTKGAYRGEEEDDFNIIKNGAVKNKS